MLGTWTCCQRTVDVVHNLGRLMKETLFILGVAGTLAAAILIVAGVQLDTQVLVAIGLGYMTFALLISLFLFLIACVWVVWSEIKWWS